MFTAQSEIKYLATKELLSPLRNMVIEVGFEPTPPKSSCHYYHYTLYDNKHYIILNILLF